MNREIGNGDFSKQIITGKSLELTNQTNKSEISEFAKNPWIPNSGSEMIDVRRHIPENNSKWEVSQIETQERIQNLETMIKRLLTEKENQKPKKISKSVKSPSVLHVGQTSKSSVNAKKADKCSNCSKLFQELNALQTICDQSRLELEKLKDSYQNERLNSQNKIRSGLKVQSLKIDG